MTPRVNNMFRHMKINTVHSPFSFYMYKSQKKSEEKVLLIIKAPIQYMDRRNDRVPALGLCCLHNHVTVKDQLMESQGPFQSEGMNRKMPDRANVVRIVQFSVFFFYISVLYFPCVRLQIYLSGHNV